ncbi:cryptochrome/photolyase family protein [Tenacibaculum sp. M341]|uniref:cryptochrome/photolyase family protein n=1 Tax=Tenacibaculum sp. M341 TaxID=2530339 RepID=UPI001045EEB1|nr:cryptochrome/photolyase family protein [Tenacibaculum sp. M341]TCI94986.1 cryptochrome/photolyase family protein [Tenacibaculum sp. M341]
MKNITILFPHQLFKNIDFLPSNTIIYMVEEALFFNQYNFHKQKLYFHRATMKFYESYLKENGFEVVYIEAANSLSDIRLLIADLMKSEVKELHIVDPTDNWLEKRIKSVINDSVELHWYDNPLFINSREDLSPFFKSTKKKFFQTTFYKEQRVKRNVLIENGGPVGGKWTYDVDNRKKYPKNKIPPAISFPDKNVFTEEARIYISNHFSKNIGNLSNISIYPITYEESEVWLQQFFEVRFHEFGDYEDAMVKEAHFLNHSVLSPLINVGLLAPLDVIHKAVEYSNSNGVPLNSLEGFVRQILGWREFIRGVYEVKGTEERTKNFWKHKRKIPAPFYTGTTGILPVDNIIKKILKTGYAHHIERLMVLGNFMLLCEFDPDEVYQWFMELFIDAYDWVMVPNVYGMSLFADGGLMSTKPYISSSNYIKKMSNYENGDWQKIWDGLFWRFMDVNRAFLSKNARLRMLITNLDKMDAEKRTLHFKNATDFLQSLEQTKELQQTV